MQREINVKHKIFALTVNTKCVLFAASKRKAEKQLRLKNQTIRIKTSITQTIDKERIDFNCQGYFTIL